ncbi:hypothetical protein [Reinekea blandensis]|uniref:Lipoprotein n=1 Tax=Reinekea blandensis MED297 TaxID=314283 RepID=A4BKB5_9GAMM|nr:hypothetical protein [Reinekea blandensis]EAR07420.1 hypothetical protein MED297_19012 [Reinekea sp. MED297] [Reinekea blandensis MED297]
MRQLICLFPIITILSGCASIDLASVEPDKLKADVTLVQSPQETQLDLHLARGLFNQPVRLGEETAVAQFTDGHQETLVAARESGRYGLRSDPITLQSLTLSSVGTISFPDMTPLRLGGKAAIADQRLYKDDLISLTLPVNSAADERYLVATARCGGQQYIGEQRLDIDSDQVTIRAGQMMDLVNNAAQADLNGIIPVELAIEERYQPNWAAPFEATKLARRDATQFTVDTSGFRFQAKVQIQVSNQLFLGFQNQSWPVKYCF